MSDEVGISLRFIRAYEPEPMYESLKRDAELMHLLAEAQSYAAWRQYRTREENDTARERLYVLGAKYRERCGLS